MRTNLSENKDSCLQFNMSDSLSDFLFSAEFLCNATSAVPAPPTVRVTGALSTTHQSVARTNKPTTTSVSLSAGK